MCGSKTNSKSETIDRLRQGITEIESRSKPSSRRKKKTHAVDDSIPTRQCKGCLTMMQLQNFSRDPATGRRGDFCGQCVEKLKEMAEKREAPVEWESDRRRKQTGMFDGMDKRELRSLPRRFKPANVLKGIRSTEKEGRRKISKRQAETGLSNAMFTSLVDQQNGMCCCCDRPLGYKLSTDVDSFTGKVHGLLCVGCLRRARSIRNRLKSGAEIKTDEITCRVADYVRRRPPVIPLM